MLSWLRVIILIARAHALWPSIPIRQLAAASYVAVAAEIHDVPSEILLAIAQHESDLEPNAVSWRSDGRTVSLLWTTQRLPSKIVCGYVQAMSTPASCRAMIAVDGGMRAGAAELVEWLTTCHGDLRCALRGHAGGTACALRGECSPAAATFARHFYDVGRELGWKPERHSS